MSNAKTTKVTLLEKIVSVFKLDDAGRADKFLKSNVKHFKQEIKQHEADLKTNELKYEIKMDKLSDQLEDAKEALDNSFFNIDVETLKNNANNDAYRETYMAGITEANSKVARLEYNIEFEAKNYEGDVEDLNDKIDICKAYIKKMTNKVF